MTGRVKNQPSVLSQPVFFPPQSKTGQLFLTAAALRNLPPFFFENEQRIPSIAGFDCSKGQERKQ